MAKLFLREMKIMTDKEYMRRAIELAKRAEGFTDPNPMVGAVIVKDGRIIGEGYHERCGELHAERNAIKNLTESAKGATIYVTLEPCCHYGKTPPCTEAIIENKIAKVVIGSRDPNPLVSGKGAAILREHGIEVVEDFLRDECDKINPVFFHYITNKTPYMVLKYAMTADGKIAASTGDSKWITGEESRNLVQRLRHKYKGIMVGIGTVKADDPMLNVRIDGLLSPVRIICDSSLSIDTDTNICKTAKEIKTIIAYAKADEKKVKALEELGVKTVCVPDENEKVDLKALVKYLGETEGIDSVLVEGGGTLNYSLLKLGLVNEVKAFIAPKLFGGAASKSPVEGEGVEHPFEAALLSVEDTEKVGDDLLITYKVRRDMTCSQE